MRFAPSRTVTSIPNTSASKGILQQLALGMLGGVLLGVSSGSRRTNTLLRLAGLALIGAAARPMAESFVRRAGERRQRVELRSTIEINRPVFDIFAFFKDFENFPRVFGGLRSVVDYQDGRSHWTAYTPSGELVEWDAVVTKYLPNSVIAWESAPRSMVDVRSMIRFTPLSPNRTRLDVTAKYNPLRTELSDAIRALMAPAAEERWNADLEHARNYLEAEPH